MVFILRIKIKLTILLFWYSTIRHKLCENKVSVLWTWIWLCRWVSGRNLLSDWRPDWTELIPLKGGKVKSCEAGSAFHSAMKTALRCLLFSCAGVCHQNQAALMTHDPWDGFPLGAGQLASVVIRPLHYTVQPLCLSLTFSLLLTTSSEQSEPKVLTCLAATIGATFLEIYRVIHIIHFSGEWQ